ncbi:aminoglycoside phosphotransferase family protein [Marivita sp. S0852]
MPNALTSPDSSYENRIRPVLRNCAVWAYHKTYARRANYECERIALSLLDGSGIAPALLHSDGATLTHTIGHCPGTPLDQLPDAQRQAALPQLFGLIRKLQSIPAAGVGPLADPPSTRAGTGADTWRSYLAAKLPQRIGAVRGPAKAVSRLRDALADGLTQLEPRLPCGLLHHDLKPANVLLGGTGQLTLVDFDQAKWGPAVSDLGKLAWRFDLWRRPAALTGLRTTFPEVMLPALRFHSLLHMIGALDYYATFGTPSYLPHVHSALTHIERLTGAKLEVPHVRD